MEDHILTIVKFDKNSFTFEYKDDDVEIRAYCTSDIQYVHPWTLKDAKLNIEKTKEGHYTVKNLKTNTFLEASQFKNGNWIKMESYLNDYNAYKLMFFRYYKHTFSYVYKDEKICIIANIIDDNIQDLELSSTIILAEIKNKIEKQTKYGNYTIQDLESETNIEELSFKGDKWISGLYY